MRTPSGSQLDNSGYTLPGDVAFLDQVQTFTVAQTFTTATINGTLTQNGNILIQAGATVYTSTGDLFIRAAGTLRLGSGGNNDVLDLSATGNASFAGSITAAGSIITNLTGQGAISIIPSAGLNFIQSGTFNQASPQNFSFSGPSSSVLGEIFLYTNALAQIGTTGALLSLTGNAGTNYFQSDNAAQNAAQNLNVCGAGVTAIPLLTLTATSTVITGALNVQGGYSANGTAGVSAGPFTVVSSITTVGGIVTALSGTSDYRLKNSRPYTGGLNEILAITPAIYSWNARGQEHTGLSGEQEFVGFIAQDVQRAIPQAITATEKSKDGTETYLSLDDRPIIAALVNAIKELEARLAALEAKQ
jgi:hypothetical protein